MTSPKPLMLIVLDGWGQRETVEGNAVRQARTPTLDHLEATYAHTLLHCCGEAVGLPHGIMGNSEVGHLNIGAGRVVYQDLLRIDRAVDDGTFFSNPALVELMDAVGRGSGRLHLLGLLSDGGVHSQFTHLLALLELARRRGLDEVLIHPILDGRDTPPDSGVAYLQRLAEFLRENPGGRIATVCGRYYAMDRDQRWDRTRLAYRLYTLGEGRPETDPVQAVTRAYDRGESDEFVRPVVLTEAGRPAATMGPGDGVVFFNFRADRARQITRALALSDCDGFDRGPAPQLGGWVCMTRYEEQFDLPVAFPPEPKVNVLGEVLGRHGLHQLRIAETEKYAHVTYFFNGGEEASFPGEERCLVPSPRDVATYDLKPQMSAEDVTTEVLRRIDSDRYDLIVLNFANMDMVGHTGDMTAAVTACETVDRCLGQVLTALAARGGAAAVTADHGNAETMLDERGRMHTAHTLNPVRLILVDESRRTAALRSGGSLADIAPTLLDILHIAAPAEMTGRSLLQA